MKNLRTIKKIDTWSFSKMYGAFGLLLGVITGILNVVVGTMEGVEINFVALFIINVITYTIVLFLGAAIFSIFYNAYAQKGRGIKVELD